MAGQPPQSQTAPIDEFRVLWTAQKKQKLKKWQDGFLRFHTYNKRMIVYDESRGLVCDMYLQRADSVQAGDNLEFEQHLVTVEEYTGRVIQDLSSMIAPILERREQRQQLQSPHPGARRSTNPIQQRVYPERAGSVVQDSPLPSRMRPNSFDTPVRAAPTFGGINGAEHRSLNEIIGGNERPGQSALRANSVYRTPARSVVSNRALHSVPPPPRLQPMVAPQTPTRIPAESNPRQNSTSRISAGGVFDGVGITDLHRRIEGPVVNRPLNKTPNLIPPTRLTRNELGQQNEEAGHLHPSHSISPEHPVRNEISYGPPIQPPQPPQPAPISRPVTIQKAPTYKSFTPPQPLVRPSRKTPEQDVVDLLDDFEDDMDIDLDIPAAPVEGLQPPRRVLPTFKRPTFVNPPPTTRLEKGVSENVDSDVEMYDSSRRTPSPPPAVQVRKRALEHVPVTTIRLGTAKRKKLLSRGPSNTTPPVASVDLTVVIDDTDSGGGPSVTKKATVTKPKGKNSNLAQNSSAGLVASKGNVIRPTDGEEGDDVVLNEDAEVVLDKSPKLDSPPLPLPDLPARRNPKQPRKSRKKGGKEDDQPHAEDGQVIGDDVGNAGGSSLKLGNTTRQQKKGKGRKKQDDSDTSKAQDADAPMPRSRAGSEPEPLGPWSVEAWDLFGYGRPASVSNL
ncbi:hypothetical protein DFH27DRAFT_18132 [Peziza echinospora]|nr:hypothetical protein DFH27DRAFT_18132 [Peziza echinospora]